ncbi:tyrosine-type recombinase/integrase [Dickeya dadantii]|uniref:tyrosine-type recombinase/integrase n=1 Tax=Dickeya dadantii TaxID=204038 RepID=UPI0014954A4D|nr:tyrosine-type recombinase/integrase [Dickeya dadantii]NPE55967.1 tyrosine-type recombinase/integrase [Dickeya dadantii]NPE68061.1 tyrosine-type recombinase/integrase [Dickeya dadantii]
MARPRKNPADNDLPPRVSRGRSAFEFKPAGGGTIRLCAFDAPMSEIWAAYERLLKDSKEQHDFASLVDRFFASADFNALGKRTRSDYRGYARKVVKPFGRMSPSDIQPQHIRKYMDKRGLKSTVQANREKAFMSRVFRWAYERGIVKINPCHGVRQYTETPRDRYITDKEYKAIYASADLLVKVAMEISYLCCARQGDVLALRRDQLLDEGIYIRQGKTGVKQIKAWSPRLRAAVAMSHELGTGPGVVSTFILHQSNGGRYTAAGFANHWRKAKEEAVKNYPDLNFDFTFHDLKAKGISDLEGTLQEKQQISGHKNIRQTATYDRKIKVVPAVDGQNKVNKNSG